MRRWLFGVSLVLAAVLIASCSDNSLAGGAASSTTDDTHEPLDTGAAEERLEVVCRRGVSEALYEECLASARAAVAEADRAGCPAASVDAWAEHVVATGLATTPHPGFWDTCPVPLSNMVLASVPAPYRPALSQRGTGLLDAAEVAESFVASPEVEAFLDEIGHEMSYAAAWVDGDNLVLVRLDRFEGPDRAAAFLDSEHRAIGQTTGQDTRQVPGINQSRVVALDRLHLATGRACEVVMTLIAQRGEGDGLSTDDVVAWFSDQARRVQASVTC